MMPEPRRILHVAHGYWPESTGGTEAYVRSLLASQSAIGLEPMLLHGSFEPRPEARLEVRDDLDVRAWRLHRADTFSDYWDKAHYPAATRLLTDLLDREQPDLVHVHQWIRLSDDIVATCESAGIPAVVSLHDVSTSCPACFRLRPDDSHCERTLSPASCRDCVPLRGPEDREEVDLGIDVYRLAFRSELLCARLVLAATRATARLVLAGLELPDDLVTVLPFGYTPRFEGLEKRPGQGRPLQIAFWGNITHRKGVQALIAALNGLGGDVELHLFGRIDTPELADELHGLAQGLPVTFHGRYEYATIAALGVDLAVFPSTCFETYGFVLDEAFELGVPALVTEIGAFAERLQGAGFVVPPGDTAALTATLQRILDDPSLLDAARARIPARGDDDLAHARQLLAAYGRACAAPARDVFGLDAGLRTRLDALRGRSPRDSEPTRRGL